MGLYPARSRLKRNMGQSADDWGRTGVGVGVAGIGVGVAGVGVDVSGTGVDAAMGVGTGVAAGSAQAERISRAEPSVISVRQARFII